MWLLLLFNPNNCTFVCLQFATHRIHKPGGEPGGDSFYPFVFSDTMGLEENPTNSGVCIEDINLALKGHMKEGYQVKLLQTVVSKQLILSFCLYKLLNCHLMCLQFCPGHELSESDPFYNKTPTDNDKVHVLVCVVPTDRMALMSDDFLRLIREVRMKASKLSESRSTNPVALWSLPVLTLFFCSQTFLKWPF